MLNKTTTEAISIAKKAMDIMRQRGQIYNNSQYNRDIHTQIMLLLFNGKMPSDPIWVARYKLISYIIDKLCRYMINQREDNCIDIANYSFLLAAEDRIRIENDQWGDDHSENMRRIEQGE